MSMKKARDTKKAILRQAVNLTSEVGLEGLTIGVLAKRAGMSKSGLYAHFESKTDLQIQVLNTAAELFNQVVVEPSLKEKKGLPRLKALFRHWLVWHTGKFSGGCPFLAASIELDDKSGLVRETLISHLEAAEHTLAKAVSLTVREGHFRPDLDIEQFVFEYWGLIFTFHHFSRLMGRKDARLRALNAFDRLITSSKSS